MKKILLILVSICSSMPLWGFFSVVERQLLRGQYGRDTARLIESIKKNDDMVTLDKEQWSKYAHVGLFTREAWHKLERLAFYERIKSVALSTAVFLPALPFCTEGTFGFAITTTYLARVHAPYAARTKAARLVHHKIKEELHSVLPEKTQSNFSANTAETYQTWHD